jgi:peptidoglycan/xylan/chitin deacetylase (PgdA/CDA1 family)
VNGQASRTMQSGGAARRWPGERKVAVVFQLVFEQWAGTHVEPGRHTAPQLPLSAIRAGTRDLVSLSWQDYAGRAGFYRLMNMASAEGVPATGLFNGLAVEKYPDIAREFAAQGHEIAAHGWSEDLHGYQMSAEEIRSDVRRTRAVIEDSAGTSPVGWCSPGYQAGPAMLETVAAEGFDYVVEMVDDDRPVLLPAGGRTLVGLSPSFDVNDNQLYLRGLNGPTAYVETFRRHLEVLAREELGGAPPLLTAVFHATLFGHPIGAWALRECIRHAKAQPDVWIATHSACAHHCLKAAPCA